LKASLKITGLLISLILLSWGVYESIHTLEGQVADQSSVHRYGKSNVVPDWMPKHWVGEFLRAIHLDIDDSLFHRSLQEMEGTLSSSAWIKDVKRLERNFKGEFGLSLNVRKPICVIESNDIKGYMDAEGEILDLLSSKEIYRLADGSLLPKVYVDEIKKDSTQDKNKWLNEVSHLISSWSGNLVINQRLQLEEIYMKPYRAKSLSECRLDLKVKDLKFGKIVDIDWGISRGYNELEDHSDEKKWWTLTYAVGQDRPFEKLDLKYKDSDIVIDGKTSFLRNR